jgi:hypothetical protein
MATVSSVNAPLVRQRIDSFRHGRLPIGPVTADLRGLADALDETPQKWKDSFVEERSVLEIAYAVALDRQQPSPTARDQRRCRSGCARGADRGADGEPQIGLPVHPDPAARPPMSGVASDLSATRCR